VAIAVTLLVLPLVELTVELREDDSVANLLRNAGWPFFAFGLSIVVIARMWLGHHEVMRPAIASSNGSAFLVPLAGMRRLLQFQTAWWRPSVTRRRLGCSTSARWPRLRWVWRCCSGRVVALLLLFLTTPTVKLIRRRR